MILDDLKLNQKIKVVDIGAAAIAETPVYKSLVDLEIADLIAIDGDIRQKQSIISLYNEKVSVISEFISDGKEHNLYLCAKESGMTSLLKPDINALTFFNGFQIFGEVIKTEKINTKKLDSLENIGSIDFLKVDAQGSELNIISNGEKSLKNCLGMQLEVSYVCLYENQPSFGEIDVYLRGKGYIPHQFLKIKRWSIKPTIFNNNFRIPGNQLLESDIIYIKNPLNLTNFHDEELKKFVLLSHYCFKSIDLCVHLILELEKRNLIEKNSHLEYLKN